MRKRKNVAQRKVQKNGRRRRNRRLQIAGAVLIGVFGIATVAGPWRETFGVKRLRALFVAPVTPPLPPPLNPSKEYIYAGGKLVATEAPSTLLAPPNLVATTVSNVPAPQVTVSWQQTEGAHHYEVEKTTNLNANYTSVNSNVTGTTVNDSDVTPVTAYLYRVRAVDANGNMSPFSNVDLATAISFADDTIESNVTLVRAVHVTQLRQAVDAVRAVTATLGPANWGPAITQYETTIQAAHIQDLRLNLDPARSLLNLPPCSYTDNSVEALRASFLKKEHIEQLRTCVK